MSLLKEKKRKIYSRTRAKTRAGKSGKAGYHWRANAAPSNSLSPRYSIDYSMHTCMYTGFHTRFTVERMSFGTIRLFNFEYNS